MGVGDLCAYIKTDFSLVATFLILCELLSSLVRIPWLKYGRHKHACWLIKIQVPRIPCIFCLVLFSGVFPRSVRAWARDALKSLRHFLDHTDRSALTGGSKVSKNKVLISFLCFLSSNKLFSFRLLWRLLEITATGVVGEVRRGLPLAEPPVHGVNLSLHSFSVR